MAVAGNLPRNVNILETFDDNELLKRYIALVVGAGPCRHFEGQWPKPKKGALRGWVLANTNFPVVTKIQLKEKTAHSVIISETIYCFTF